MGKQVGLIVGACIVAVLVGIVVGYTVNRDPAPEVTPDPAAVTRTVGTAPVAPLNFFPPPTDGDPARLEDPQMDEARISAFTRIDGDDGATHQRVAAVLAESEHTVRQRVFVHTAVQDYLDSMATYRDQVAAGEMQERDLVFNDEEARDALDDTLRQRLQDDADRVLDVL